MADEPPTDDDMAGMWRELQWARARDAEPRLTRTEYEMRTVREYEAWRPRRDRDKAAIAAARAEALVSRPTRVEWWGDPTVERREAAFLTVTDAGKERGFALQRDRQECGERDGRQRLDRGPPRPVREADQRPDREAGRNTFPPSAGLKQQRVRGSLAGAEFVSNVMPAGGGRLALSVSKGTMAASHHALGDQADLEISGVGSASQ